MDKIELSPKPMTHMRIETTLNAKGDYQFQTSVSVDRDPYGSSANLETIYDLEWFNRVAISIAQHEIKRAKGETDAIWSVDIIGTPEPDVPKIDIDQAIRQYGDLAGFNDTSATDAHSAEEFTLNGMKVVIDPDQPFGTIDIIDEPTGERMARMKTYPDGVVPATISGRTALYKKEQVS